MDMNQLMATYSFLGPEKDSEELFVFRGRLAIAAAEDVLDIKRFKVSGVLLSHASDPLILDHKVWENMDVHVVIKPKATIGFNAGFSANQAMLSVGEDDMWRKSLEDIYKG